MTSLESLVPSLDLCRQLQAAGFPQDTAMVYAYIKDANSKIVRVVMPRRDAEAGCIGADCDGQMILCAAPTAEEILRELPRDADMKRWTRVNQLHDGYGVEIRTGDIVDGYAKRVCAGTGPRLVEAAAHAYLWWKKEVAG